MSDALPRDFAYATHAVRVVFGAGSLTRLPAELERSGMRRVMLLSTSARQVDNQSLRTSLGGRLAGAFHGARMHVPREVVDAALAAVHDAKPDTLLAFGGGSAIGLGKALALETDLPLAAIPTTYSGSEMTSIWGISDGSEKRTGRDPRVAPRLVLYDPELTFGLPLAMSAASGMNAVAHCVEALYAPDGSPVSMLLAMHGLQLLATHLPDVVESPLDVAARAKVLTGSHLAGRALDLTSMGLHHRLAHVLGGSFGLPHAATHAALLPCVTAFNAPDAPDAMGLVAAALQSADAYNGVQHLARTLGTPTLADLGFTAEMIPRAAELAATGSYPNPRPVNAAAVRSILECALAGSARS